MYNNDLLNRVTAPGRYLPTELFAYRKDLSRARLSVALAFPDTYEVGMSHLGARILYHLLNEQEEIACDRAYAPWPDMEDMLRQKGIPLASHESQVPLKDFDILGFSLAYELSYTNVLNMLELSGIPLLAADRRQGRWPLVIGGGPCASNPEPMADFFDAFLFGDGEEAILEICGAFMEAAERGGGRDEILDSWSRIRGVYVPEFFEPVHRADGRVIEVRRLKEGYDKVERRIVADLAESYFPTRPLVPVLEPIHDRVMVEVARGCTRGCRFCHAGIIYRPYRERPVEKALEIARASLAATGYEECSLLSLSAGDYSRLPELLFSLIREHFGQRVSVSLPSLRVASLADSVLKAIELVRKTGFTLAPEAGTERLRDAINKCYSEAELMETARRVFDHGWRNLKLYFMVGLPTETGEDVEAIVRLAKRISGVTGLKGRPQVSVSVSGFVPKAHTPFQWESQADVESLFGKIDFLKSRVPGKGRKLKWHDPGMTEIEGVLSRGDRRVGGAILAAFRKGRRFDGWSESFDREVWLSALAERGLDPAFYTTRSREQDEVFPWDHLDPLVSRAWLWEERERCYRGEVSPDCADAGCERPCGVCDHDRIKPRSYKGEAAEVELPALEKSQPESFFLYRVRYGRSGSMKWMGQLEVTRLFTRLVRRADLPVRFSQGYHPMPRIMFGAAPPVGVASEAEYVDLELVSRVEPKEIHARLSASVPPGIRVMEVEELPPRSASVSAAVTGYDYEVKDPTGEAEFGEDAISSFMSRETFPINQKRAKGDREVDLRPLVKYLESRDGGLFMGIRVLEGPGVKPQEVVSNVFGFSPETVGGFDFTRKEAWFRRASPVRYPGSGERARRTRGGRG